MNVPLYGFILGMWALILVGGGIAVMVLGPFHFSGLGEYDGIVTSGIKAIVAIGMVIIWVVVLSKIKKIILRGQPGI